MWNLITQLWTLKELSQLWILCTRLLTETSRNLNTPPWTQRSFGAGVHKFQECSTLLGTCNLSVTRNFKIRQHVARLCRADSQHRVLNTIEWLHCRSLMTHNTFKWVACFKVSHSSNSSIHTADGLQLIQIRDGCCTLGLHVFSSFRCRPLPTFLMWKFIHQEIASAWDRDFVDASDKFSLVGTLSAFKRPS